MAQVVVPKPLNPLDNVAQLLGIKQAAQNVQLQRQQIAQGQQQATTQNMNAQQQQALQSIFKDPANWDPAKGQLTDQALLKVGQIHPQTQAELLTAWQRDPKSLETIQNLKSEEDYRTAQAGNLKSDNERAAQAAKDTADRLNASESAGILIPGSEANVINPATKQPARSQQFKVRKADGSYTIETRYTDPLYEKPDKAAAISNDFELWMKQNPNGTAEQWQALQQKNALALKAGEAKLKPPSGDLPDLKYLTDTTSNGNSYIDASKVEPKTLNELQQNAGKAGLKVVDKDTAAGLKESDVVRANQKTMMDLIESKLPKDAQGRLLKGPSNAIEKLAQSDPALASMGTFSAAAIASLRAVAGAKNFRMTQTELNNAIQNFVPQASDTLDTAHQKLKNLKDFMDNKEKVALGLNTVSNPGSFSNAPKVGTVQGGYIYQGGDPANQNSWKKQ